MHDVILADLISSSLCCSKIVKATKLSAANKARSLTFVEFVNELEAAAAKKGRKNRRIASRKGRKETAKGDGKTCVVCGEQVVENRIKCKTCDYLFHSPCIDVVIPVFGVGDV